LTLGWAKTRGSWIAIEQFVRSRPFETANLQARSLYRVQRKNIILGVLRNFAFSHSQDPKPTFGLALKQLAKEQAGRSSGVLENPEVRVKTPSDQSRLPPGITERN
jgi:hypothetical protein